MEFAILQSKIADKQFPVIFAQILMTTKDCFIAREYFFQMSIYNFAFTSLLKILLDPVEFSFGGVMMGVYFLGG